MNNEEKLKAIHPWIDLEERVTVSFLDEQGLNAEVTGCTEVLVDLSLEVSEDPSHYTRNPNRPLKHRRLMLSIDDKRPPIVY